ncbi:acyl transferase/acyl hydrolase/lysophospholipase [Zopfochytrium polystomum]|nr:acyl transferase/acyl hydrolase/lysophospholipase [Zopfochytrium polystomum]
MRSGLRKVALLFPGQGAQHIGMAADIYRTYPAAKRIVDQCDDAIGGGLRKLMFEGPVQSLTSTEVAQPAILCHSIAMLRVLEEEHGFDIKNCLYALGHSLGEYSALVATKSISLEVALKLVRLRGLAMRTATSSKQTSMRALVINGNHLEDIEALMESIKQSLPDGEVAEISNINSRAQVVLSGTAKGVEYAGSKIQTKGFAGRSIALPVSAPFHCSLMSPAAEKMKPALDGTTFSDPIIDVISNVTGKPFNHPDEIGRLLTDQITKTVQWQRSIQYAREDGVQEWIAVGPSRVLSNLLKKEYPLDVVRCISSEADVRAFGGGVGAR